MFPHRVSLLEVRMSCRLVSSSMFQCHEDVAGLCECCPSGRNSSLNLLVFVFVLYLSQVDVASNALDLSVVDIYWCVVFHHHLCLRFVHRQTLTFTFMG